MDLARAGALMPPLTFDDHGELSRWIKANGPLPVSREVRVGARMIRTGRPEKAQLVATG